MKEGETRMENILEELKWRGLVKDCSNEEALKKLLENKQTIYCGFDPSAKSMHLGNFVMISILMRLQRAGHKIIALVGGVTGMIGDPSGKSQERNLLDVKTLENNRASIKKQLERFLDLEDESKGELLDNYEWLGHLTVIDFLRNYGKYFPINYMLSKDIIASRMSAGISYSEFSYMILQSIDFLHLYDEKKCHIQIGGSDQWGNLTSGLELIRKVRGTDADVEVLTAPLITRSDGRKFGKSEEGALFLDKELTSPYKLYQYLVNSTDEDALRYLKIFTFLSKEEIEKISEEHVEAPHLRLAQNALAYEVTKTIHGEEGALEAKRMSEILFSGDVTSLNKSQLEEVFSSFIHEINEEMKLEDLLIVVGAAKSKREAREFLNGNSIQLNGEKIKDGELIISKERALYSTYYLLKRGKKNYYLVKLTY